MATLMREAMATTSDIVLTEEVKPETSHSTGDFAELGFRAFSPHPVGVSQGSGSWDWDQVPCYKST